MLQITATLVGSRFKVRVIPRARMTGLDGLRGDATLCRVRAAAVGGAANEALVRLLSEAVTVTRGHHSRNKEVQVKGLAPETVLAHLVSPRL